MSTLGERADQTRREYERAKQLRRYETDVRRGKAKPPVIVLTKGQEPRYFLGLCLGCSVELWVHSAKPRVPLCPSCRSKR